MAERVPILDGAHWVVFRDPSTVTNRQRRPYQRVFAQILQGKRPAEDADFAWEYASAVSFMFLAEWSLDEPLPTEWDLFLLYLEDQPGQTSDAIAIEASRYLMAQATEVEAVPPTRRKPRAST